MSAAKSSATVDRVPVLHLLSYGALAMPLALAEIPILIYLPAFYAQELAVSAGLIGAVFFMARLFDGLFDIVMGWLTDRTRSRWGRSKPWIVAGAPVLMFAVWRLCNPPEGAGLSYLWLWTALFYTAFTVIKIPYWSWGVAFSDDYAERSRVTGYREAFTMLGNLFFFAAPLVLLSDSQNIGDVLQLISIALIISVPIAIALLVHLPDSSPRAVLPRAWFALLGPILREPVMLRFMVAMLFYFLVNGVANALLVFAYGVGLGLPGFLLWAVFLTYTTMLLMLPAVGWISRRVEKHQLLGSSLAALMLAFMGLAISPSGQVWTVIPIVMFVGVGLAGILILPMSVLADIVDHGEVKGGTGQTGAYAALFNLISKLGTAIGVGVAFQLLDLVGFDVKAASHSAADVRNIRLLGFVLPALLLLPAVILVLRHPITRGVHASLQTVLAERGGRAEP